MDNMWTSRQQRHVTPGLLGLLRSGHVIDYHIDPLLVCCWPSYPIQCACTREASAVGPVLTKENDMTDDLIALLAADLKVPESQALRLLFEMLAPQLRERHAAEELERERELQERQAAELRRTIARAHLRRRAPP
jgi:hypothetical protein